MNIRKKCRSTLIWETFFFNVKISLSILYLHLSVLIDFCFDFLLTGHIQGRQNIRDISLLRVENLILRHPKCSLIPLLNCQGDTFLKGKFSHCLYNFKGDKLHLNYCIILKFTKLSTQVFFFPSECIFYPLSGGITDTYLSQ